MELRQLGVLISTNLMSALVTASQIARVSGIILLPLDIG
jgi:hypothetical protein